MTPASSDARLPLGTTRLLEWSPLILLGGFWFAMVLPATQDFCALLLRENYPVELLTFLAALAGAVIGFRLVARLRAVGAPAGVRLFFLLFSIGLLLLAGEEVSWGQDFYWYKTPRFIRLHNAQNQVTLHNLEIWHGHNHLLRLFFGVGGLLGLWLGRFPALRPVTPPPLLWLWFSLITMKSLVDVYVKNVPVSAMTFYEINKVSEVVEMMVAFTGLLYLWLKTRAATGRADPALISARA